MKEEDRDRKQKKNLIDHINEQEAADTRVQLSEDEVRDKTERERTTLWKLRRDKILIADKDGPYLRYIPSSVYAYLRARAGGSR
jgi:hypothetical protein